MITHLPFAAGARTMRFSDRAVAGRHLAQQLRSYKGRGDVVVALAGAVVVGARRRGDLRDDRGGDRRRPGQRPRALEHHQHAPPVARAQAHSRWG